MRQAVSLLIESISYIYRIQMYQMYHIYQMYQMYQLYQMHLSKSIVKDIPGNLVYKVPELKKVTITY